MNSDRVYYSHEAEMHAVRNRTVLTLVFLTFCLGIGAALALLFAPKSGRRVREDLTRTVEQGWKDGRKAVEPMVKRVEKDLGALQQTVEEHLKQS